jgi:hypothetical protein
MFDVYGRDEMPQALNGMVSARYTVLQHRLTLRSASRLAERLLERHFCSRHGSA